MGVGAAKSVSKGMVKGVAKRMGVDSLIRPVKSVIDDVAEAAAKKGTKKGGSAASKMGKAADGGAGAAKKGAAKRSANKPGVKKGDVGSYKDLNKKAKPYDGLQHDHIPSAASLKKAAEEKMGRPLTKAEKDALHQRAQTIAVPDDWHKNWSRTYGHKNTAAQIAKDAADLPAAVRRDIGSYTEALLKEGWSPSQIDEFFEPLIKANDDFLNTEWWK